MTFNEFIIAINNCFNNFFTHIIDIINPLLENNLIKLIIYLSIFSFIVFLLFSIIKIIYLIFNRKNNKEIKNKKDKENNIE